MQTIKYIRSKIIVSFFLCLFFLSLSVHHHSSHFQAVSKHIIVVDFFIFLLLGIERCVKNLKKWHQFTIKHGNQTKNTLQTNVCPKPRQLKTILFLIIMHLVNLSTLLALVPVGIYSTPRQNNPTDIKSATALSTK